MRPTLRCHPRLWDWRGRTKRKTYKGPAHGVRQSAEVVAKVMRTAGRCSPIHISCAIEVFKCRDHVGHYENGLFYVRSTYPWSTSWHLTYIVVCFPTNRWTTSVLNCTDKFRRHTLQSEAFPWLFPLQHIHELPTWNIHESFQDQYCLSSGDSGQRLLLA